MKKTILSLAVLATGLFLASSCKKAGTDGNATVVVFAKHHGNIIKNHVTYPDSVFVKFNATELPTNPTTNYDALFVGEVGEDHIHLESLHTGKYFVYVTGYDSSINSRVTGGAAIKVKWSERKKEIDTDVAVTE